MTRSLLVILILATSGMAKAQTGSEAAVAETPAKMAISVRQQIDSFFIAIEKHQIDAAYDQLTKGTKIAERAEDIATLKSKTQQATQLFGDLLGHEMVELKNVSGHLLRATYISLGKDYPLRWRFYFYNGGDAWRLIDIRVDDRLADIFGETPSTDQKPTNWPRSQ
ncbi:MAG: hypothetical protein QOD99_3193 [Chthoniobacter sp.]|jgi:hypothetical protein|nr:hypothetical protein [Chthoniobacter sp.]